MFKFIITDLHQAHLLALSQLRKNSIKVGIFFIVIFGLLAFLELKDDLTSIVGYLWIAFGILFPYLIIQSPKNNLKQSLLHAKHIYTSIYTITFEKDYIRVHQDDDGRLNDTLYYYDRIFKIESFNTHLVIHTHFNNLLILPMDTLFDGDKEDLIPYVNYLLNGRISVITPKK